MKNNLFILFITLVIAGLLIVAGTLVHLSKTSEFSRAADAPSADSNKSGQ